MWVWVNTKYACGGIEVDCLNDSRIITAPPIWRKYLGVRLKDFFDRIGSHNAHIKLPEITGVMKVM